MTDPDPALELLARHLQNLHELLRLMDIRLRRIEACLGLMGETGRLTPLGSLQAPHSRRSVGWGDDDPSAA